MAPAILILSILAAVTAAHVGERHPYGIYPSASVEVSSSSPSMSRMKYAGDASYLHDEQKSVMSSYDVSTSTECTHSTSVLTSAIDTVTSPTAETTISSVDASSTCPNATAPSASGALPRATCVSVTIGDVIAGGVCGCSYNIHTCLERLSNLSEWSTTQTTDSFGGCMKACDSEPNCFSFTWQTSSGICKMFGGMLNGGAGVVSDSDYTSGEVVEKSCTGNCNGGG
jgi:hypothetical protein